MASNSDSSKRDKQLVAARHLVQVLELAEALPFTPKRHLDPPAMRPIREFGGPRSASSLRGCLLSMTL